LKLVKDPSRDLAGGRNNARMKVKLSVIKVIKAKFKESLKSEEPTQCKQVVA
jgi:hypothetical protein